MVVSLSYSLQVYKNLSLFTKNKKGSEDLFDLLSVGGIHKYLFVCLGGGGVAISIVNILSETSF